MNKRKQAIAVLLVLVLVMSLAACAKKNPLAGTWEGKLDVSKEVIGPASAAMGAMGAALPGVELPDLEDYLGELVFVYSLSFNEDGTYLAQVDQEKFQACIDQLKTGIADYYRDLFAAVLIRTAVEMGLAEEINSVEELEAVLEIDLDEAINESLGMDLSTFVNSIMDASLESVDLEEQLSGTGNYEMKENKLFMSQGADGQIFPEVYNTYTVEGDVLTISAGPAGLNSQLSQYFPLVLEKVA